MFLYLKAECVVKVIALIMGVVFINSCQWAESPAVRLWRIIYSYSLNTSIAINAQKCCIGYWASVSFRFKVPTAINMPCQRRYLTTLHWTSENGGQTLLEVSCEPTVTQWSGLVSCEPWYSSGHFAASPGHTVIGAPIISGWCPSLSAHDSEPTLRTIWSAEETRERER
jgi:hypothetical protein